MTPQAAIPRAPLDEVRSKALELRSHEHPGVSDDELTLAIYTVHTSGTTAAIARTLGADKRWAYAALARPEVQQLIAKLSMAVLGVAATRAVRSMQQQMETTTDERLRFDISRELADRGGIGNTTDMRREGQSRPFAFMFGDQRPRTA